MFHITVLLLVGTEFQGVCLGSALGELEFSVFTAGDESVVVEVDFVIESCGDGHALGHGLFGTEIDHSGVIGAITGSNIADRFIETIITIDVDVSEEEDN